MGERTSGFEMTCIRNTSDILRLQAGQLMPRFSGSSDTLYICPEQPRNEHLDNLALDQYQHGVDRAHLSLLVEDEECLSCQLHSD